MSPTTIIAGLVLGGALALAGFQAKQAADARAETAKVGKQFAEYRETQERQTRESLEKLRADKSRSDKLRQEAQDAEHLARIAAQADADRLRGTAGQLRRYAADLASSLSHRPGDPAAAPGGPPAGSAADLLAELSGRIDDAAGAIAIHAAEARRAGLLCVKSYEALTP